MHKVVFDSAGVGNTWHSHPPLAVIVKAGSYTVHTGDASGCTSKTYTAGPAVIDPSVVAYELRESRYVEVARLSAEETGELDFGAGVARLCPTEGAQPFWGHEPRTVRGS